MTELDPSIILAGQFKASGVTDAVQAGQQIAGNQQKLQAGAMANYQTRQDISDDQRLTAALRTVDPTSPTYNEDVVKAAQQSGVSGKTLLDLQKNMLSQKNQQLDSQIKSQTIADNYFKLNQDQKTAFDKQISSSLEDMGNIEDAWKSSNGNVSLVTTLINKNLEDEVNNKLLTPQQAQALKAKVFPGGTFSFSAFDAAYQQTKGAAAIIDAQKTKAITAKDQAEAATAGTQLVPVQSTDASGNTTTTYAVVDRKTGRTIDTGDKVGAKPGAGGQNATPTQRGLEVQAQMALQGVPIPAGVTGIGASGKAQFFNTLANQYPDKSPTEIAQLAKSGKLDMTAATKEIQVAAGKASSTAAAVASIFGPKGEAETVMQAAQDAGLSDLKGANWTEQQWRKFTSDPKWAGYVSANKELVSSMAQIFSRGGASSVHAQEEAQEMFPLNSSIDELKTRLATSRQIAAAVERGNETVIDAIKNGKSLSDIIAGTTSTGATANTAAPKTTASGATVSSWN